MALFRNLFAVLVVVVSVNGMLGCSQSRPAAAPKSAGSANGPAQSGAGTVGVPCPAPEPLRVSFEATARLNPGDRGEPLAVVVRVYQLKGVGKLQGAAFDDLLDREKETLGEDLVGSTEVTVNPGDRPGDRQGDRFGERVDPPMTRHPDAVYIAAVALFRRPAGNTWRTFKRLAPVDPQHCHPPTGTKGTAPPMPTRHQFMLDENRIDLR